jgi:predicted ATP-dependent serine protease
VITPTRALALAADAEPLPRVPELRYLYDYGFLPRRGQFLMVAGQPGAGKSAFILWWTVKMNVRTLYFSADMDAFTAITRLAACISGFEVNAIADAIENEASGFIEEALNDSKVQFCFDSGPTLQDIADEIDAYVELWDAFPELIVIDNAMNVEAEYGEEHAGLRLVLKEVHRMARECGAAVFMLHHTREEGNPWLPQSRDKVQGKVNQLPERILTVAFDTSASKFLFAPVKNRSGKQDATGNTYFALTAVPERATFKVYEPPPAPVSYVPQGWYAEDDTDQTW